mmetsp:Transcript_28505/g.67931  ORF Transcript_28505/g.67931 Transcript_28505/m.67931 type:complete len:318 (-) Transcript_28505:4517-5470(-)
MVGLGGEPKPRQCGQRERALLWGEPSPRGGGEEARRHAASAGHRHAGSRHHDSAEQLQPGLHPGRPGAPQAQQLHRMGGDGGRRHGPDGYCGGVRLGGEDEHHRREHAVHRHRPVPRGGLPLGDQAAPPGRGRLGAEHLDADDGPRGQRDAHREGVPARPPGGAVQLWRASQHPAGSCLGPGEPPTAEGTRCADGRGGRPAPEADPRGGRGGRGSRVRRRGGGRPCRPGDEGHRADAVDQPAAEDHAGGDVADGAAGLHAAALHGGRLPVRPGWDARDGCHPPPRRGGLSARQAGRQPHCHVLLEREGGCGVPDRCH